METVKQLLQDKAVGSTWAVSPDATADEAMRLMTEKNIGALPVVENGQLVGIVSERDFARKLFLIARPVTAIKVSELMSSPVVYVLPHQTRDECMALVTSKRTRHLPVLENGRLIGMVSIGDLVRSALSEQQFIIEQLEHYITDSRAPRKGPPAA